jgi:hypothetical protein
LPGPDASTASQSNSNSIPWIFFFGFSSLIPFHFGELYYWDLIQPDEIGFRAENA